MISGLEEARLIFAAVRASLVLEPAPALVRRHRRRQRGDHDRRRRGPALGDERAARRRPAHRRVRARRPAVESRPQTARRTHPRRARAARRRGAPPRAADGGRDERHDQRPRAPGGRRDETARCPRAPTACAPSAPSLEALHDRIMRATTAERRRLPGIEDKRADLLPAGATLLVTRFDLFELDGLMTSDWALREGIVLDAVRMHDPDDWSDDPRALRRAAVAGLARRCGSDVAHTAARRASRAEPLRPDHGRCTASVDRRPRDARVRRAAARHRPARVAQGPPPARRVPRRSRRAPRLRARRDRVPRRARAPSPARRHQGSRGPLRRARQGRPRAAPQARGAAPPRRRPRSWSTRRGRGASTRTSAPTSSCSASKSTTTPSSSSGACAAAANCSRRSSSGSWSSVDSGRCNRRLIVHTCNSCNVRRRKQDLRLLAGGKG